MRHLLLDRDRRHQYDEGLSLAMYAAIVFLPLLGFLIAGPFGWRIGARPSEIVTTGFLFIAALLSWIVFSKSRSEPRLRACRFSAIGSPQAR